MASNTLRRVNNMKTKTPMTQDGNERECNHCAKLIYDAREKNCPDCGKHWKAKTEAKHTLTPWNREDGGEDNRGSVIFGPNGETIAETTGLSFDGENGDDEDRSNAEFIVRAVNSHKGLVMRLKDMAKKYHEMTSHNGYFHNCEVSWCKDNREAIAQAEGEGK